MSLYLNLFLHLCYIIISKFCIFGHCSNAKYVLKVDDDVFVNSFSLLNYLDNLKLKTKNNLLCRLRKRSTIVRDLNSKFYISYNITKKKFYSQYCDGPAYIFQGNLASALYKASLHIKYFKLEDIYFGLLANYLELNFIDLKAKYLVSNNLSQNDDIFLLNLIIYSRR